MSQSVYFGSGIVSNFDKYSEIKKTSSIPKPVKKKVHKDDTGSKSPLYPIEVLDCISVSYNSYKLYIFNIFTYNIVYF